MLLHVSNFRPVKRVLDVVRIFERVSREVDAVLLMVGDGPERSSAQALARRLGLVDRLRFLGTRQDIEDVVALADVFLLPSELESFGLSALEAMAAACRSSAPTPAGCPRSCVTPRAATCCRSATSRAWPRGRSRSCATTSGGARWARRPGTASRRSSTPSAWSEQYEAVYERVLGA